MNCARRSATRIKFSSDRLADFFRMSCRDYIRRVLALIQTMIVFGFILLLLASMLPAFLLARKSSQTSAIVTLARATLPVTAPKARS